MRAISTMALAGCLAITACNKSDGGGDDDGDPPPDPKGWTIELDMSSLDRFVTPETATAWEVKGLARATEGLATVEVAGAAASPDGSGAFSSSVAVMPGLTRVSILARDKAGHERKGDRTLLAARFLPDTMHNSGAASLILDDAILASMGAGLASQAGTVDIAAEIMMRDVLSQDDRCVTWPTAASQGEVAVSLVEDRGDLWLRIRIPQLEVRFAGTCQGLISQIPIAGEFGGNIDVWTRLTAKPAAAGGCLTAFAHTEPEVQISGWGFDVWGTGGPLQNWIITMFQGEKSTEARNQIAGEVGTRADTMLTEKLANISVFDRTSQMDMLGRPVSMHLCLGGLDKVNGVLVARVAAAASSAGTRMAPGAPQLDGAVPAAKANELLLDANLVGQLLYASWRDGGLTRGGPEVDVGVLQALVPALYERHPNATVATVMIDSELPPLVRATPGAAGDLSVELGDLMVDLTVEGERIFRFGVNLKLALDLVPMDGKLMPMVVDTSAEVALLDELLDGPDAALEQAVKLQIGQAAASLLGGAAAIALPDLPGLGAPTDVVADPAGRYVRVKLN